MSDARPGPLTLIAFSLTVLIGGSNFVAVRLSNRELPPLYGAGARFLGAALLLFAISKVARISLPRSRALTGSIVFGVLNFFAAYALFYWGMQRVPAALGGVVFGTVPLMTFVLAVVQGLEAFRWRALAGASIAILGVAVMVRAPSGVQVGALYIGAVVLSGLGAAEAAVVVKRFPTVHPIPMNAVAMGVAAPLLLALSLLTGERWAIPQRATTWAALAFLVPIGSAGLFILYVYVVQRWSASGASYQFVLFPVVTALTAALVIDEPLNASVAFGAVLVVAGTYVGALASTRTRPAPATVRTAPLDPSV